MHNNTWSCILLFKFVLWYTLYLFCVEFKIILYQFLYRCGHFNLSLIANQTISDSFLEMCSPVKFVKLNNELCISQAYSNDNVKTSRLQDTHIVMNKGEINTGESNENENVHKSCRRIFRWCIFLLELLKVKFRRFFKIQLQLQKGCKNIKQSKLLTQKRYVRYVGSLNSESTRIF
jgi:hypothetical protein